jgi:hypothetical protein
MELATITLKKEEYERYNVQPLSKSIFTPDNYVCRISEQKLVEILKQLPNNDKTLRPYLQSAGDNIFWKTWRNTSYP